VCVLWRCSLSRLVYLFGLSVCRGITENHRSSAFGRFVGEGSEVGVTSTAAYRKEKEEKESETRSGDKSK
jgi:hypothetical protein